MTEPHSHEHGIQAGHVQPGGIRALFPDEEWEQFERSDLGAGKVVVALMTGIFLVGLILYTVILVAVA